MPTYQLLTDRSLAQSSAITPTTLIHIVYTGDPSQNIAGSSYKAELGQLAGLFSGGSVSGDYLPLSGGTVSGSTNFTNGLTANTISATTYLNLPLDIRVTGGTYSAGTATFTNNTGGTFNVTGFTTGTTSSVSGDYLPLSGGTVSGATNFTGGLSANTISATTYQNLPTDIRVTGSTYSNNTFTSTNNTGGTYNVLFNTVTGLTVNGDLSVTGNTGLGTTSANTILELYGDNGSALRNVLRFTDSDTTVGVVPQFIGKLEFNGNETSGTGVKCFIGGIQNSAAQGSLVFGTTGTTGSLTGGTLTSTERMRIDHNGYVGINDTSPSYRLEVSSGVESVDEVITHFRNDSSKGLLFIPVANNDSFNFNTTSGDTVLVSTTGQPLIIGC
jgi:trimeric autotransporter adhesin